MKKNKILIILMFLYLFKLDTILAETIYKEYKIGDKITYNGMAFYVIEDSDSSSDRVTMLKETPLTVDEVNKYGGVGTDNNHVNMYAVADTAASYHQTAKDMSGYGGMAYYSSSTCGFDGTNWVYDKCISNYSNSEVKYVVDAWALDKFSNGGLVEDKTGYSARLLTFEDLTTNLGYTKEYGVSYMKSNTESTPPWVYNTNYFYWTMSQYENSDYDVWIVNSDGGAYKNSVNAYSLSVVRPVITIKKEPIEKKKLTDKEYEIGDLIEYNGMNFYVIKNSGRCDSTLTLLKETPLLVNEVNKYGIDSNGVNHVNRYTESSVGTAFDIDGYGGVAYYTSETCGYVNDLWMSDDCVTEYDASDIKYIVDGWASENLNSLDLETDSLGYKVRLIAYEDLINDLGYEVKTGITNMKFEPLKSPSFIHLNNYYWTMSPYEDSASYVWDIESDCVYANFVNLNNKYIGGVIRPVITLRKQNYDPIDKCNNLENSENDELKDNHNHNNNNNNQIIKVPDTHLSKKTIFIVIGVALIIASIIVRYIIIKRNKNNKIDKTA